MIIWRAIRRLPATALWVAMSVAALALMAVLAATAAQPPPANGPCCIVLIK